MKRSDKTQHCPICEANAEVLAAADELAKVVNESKAVMPTTTRVLAALSRYKELRKP